MLLMPLRLLVLLLRSVFVIRVKRSQCSVAPATVTHRAPTSVRRTWRARVCLPLAGEAKLESRSELGWEEKRERERERERGREREREREGESANSARLFQPGGGFEAMEPNRGGWGCRQAFKQGTNRVWMCV